MKAAETSKKRQSTQYGKAQSQIGAKSISMRNMMTERICDRFLIMMIDADSDVFE